MDRLSRAWYFQKGALLPRPGVSETIEIEVCGDYRASDRASMVARSGAFSTSLACGRAHDMRRGMNGLTPQVQETLGRDPFADDLYVFRGARGDLAKILLARWPRSVAQCQGWSAAAGFFERPAQDEQDERLSTKEAQARLPHTADDHNRRRRRPGRRASRAGGTRISGPDDAPRSGPTSTHRREANRQPQPGLFGHGGPVQRRSPARASPPRP